jgi:hypothetical protein
MSLYRCRYLDRAFDVFQIQGVACENDAEAIAMARRMSANTGAAGFECDGAGRLDSFRGE